MPEIEIESPTAWTINGTARQHADQNCMAIMTMPTACTGCPMAVYAIEEPPSAFLTHLLHIDGLQTAGAHFAFADLPMIEWKGLKLLHAKRNEKQIKDMKKK